MDELRCAACGTPAPAGAAFCGSCGAALTPNSPTSAARAEAAPSGWALATAGMSAPAPSVGPNGPLDKSECAGWWQRFGAWLLDGFILGTVFGVVGLVVAGVAYLVDPTIFDRIWDSIDDAFTGTYDTYDPSASDDLSEDDAFTTWVFGITGAFWLASLVWDVLWIRSRHMGKPGQRICGFRVVRAEDVTRLTTRRSIGRGVAKLLYNIPQLGGLVSIVSAFTIGLTARRQAIHELVAGTASIRNSAWERRERGEGPPARGFGTPGAPVSVPLPPGVAQAQGGVPVPPGVSTGMPVPPGVSTGTPVPPPPGAATPPPGASTPPPLPPAPGTTPPGPPPTPPSPPDDRPHRGPFV